ncbi:reverse transcriptase domain-containing protein, partial [Pseudalkalibacillus decolorationis]|uniref:reverse transcriptase domain-containing protein n=1 Tax=Pseudalkalibacillus decolorationis TaxID=163879 RepID=UPI002147D70A
SFFGGLQGGVISPLLANIYLDEFDWGMKASGFPVVRYADDAIIFCKTKTQAEKAHQVAKTILEDRLHLTMHPEKTKVVHFKEGFSFLGFNESTSTRKRFANLLEDNREKA